MASDYGNLKWCSKTTMVEAFLFLVDFRRTSLINSHGRQQINKYTGFNFIECEKTGLIMFCAQINTHKLSRGVDGMVHQMTCAWVGGWMDLVLWYLGCMVELNYCRL